MERLIRYLIIIFLTIVFYSKVVSQDELLLTPFTTAISNLDQGERDVWLLPALSGGLLSFKLSARTGDLEPKLRITDETGEFILDSDDVSQKDKRSVLIESFSVPYSAVYSIEVYSLGTTGEYALEVLPGFASFESFDITDPETWSFDENGQILFSPERLLLITTLDKPLVNTSLNSQIEYSRFYIHAEIEAIDSSENWLVGLTIGSSDTSYFVYSVNQDGLWRFALHQKEETEIIREWQFHPAITAGENKFSIGLLINQDRFELFYKGQSIESVRDDRLPSSNTIGLTVGYGNIFPVQTRVHFSRFVVTSPMNDEEDFSNFRFVPISQSADLRALTRAGIIPINGNLGTFVTEANWQAVLAGVTYFPLNEQIVRNMVFATTVHWNSEVQSLAGCGLVGGITDSEEYYLAFIDNGGYGLTYHTGNEFRNYSFVTEEVNPQEEHHILIIVQSDFVIYFLNGRYSGHTANATNAGLVAFAVLNYENGLTRCSFVDSWLWVWN